MIFVTLKQCHVWHEIAISQYGGDRGVLSDAKIESGLARPINHFTYHPESTVGHLAALTCLGVLYAHGYRDGNKRVALYALDGFLFLNGYSLDADQVEVYEQIMTMAGPPEARPAEESFSEWVEANITPLPTPED